MKTGKTKSKRRGMVLPFVISIAVVLAILGIGILQLGFGSRLVAAVTMSGISARSAADGGISQALHQMTQALPPPGSGAIFNDSWIPYSSGELSFPSSNSVATYSYEITKGPVYAGRVYYLITSTGTSGRETRRVNALTTVQTMWFGIGVQDTVNVHSSPDAEFTFLPFPENSDDKGSVRTNSIANSAIWVGPNSTIQGQVLVGPGGNTETGIHEGPNSSIGSSGVAQSELDFPPAVLPPAAGSWPTWSPNYVQLVNEDPVAPVLITRALIESGDYQLPNFSIEKDAGTTWTEVRIRGGVRLHASNEVRFYEGTKLIIEPGSALELFVGTDAGPTSPLTAYNGSEIITMDRESWDLKIYGLPSCTSTGNSPTIALHNSGVFWGVIYAPSANLVVDNTADFYGGFIGYSLTMMNNAVFHYDTRLYDLQNEGPLFFQINRWWEEVVP